MVQRKHGCKKPDLTLSKHLIIYILKALWKCIILAAHMFYALLIFSSKAFMMITYKVL